MAGDPVAGDPVADPGSDDASLPAAVPTAVPSAVHGRAVVALACAVGAWALVPVVLAVVALLLAGQAERSIAASPGTRTGEGLVTAARVVAWSNIVAWTLGALFVAAVAFGLRA